MNKHNIITYSKYSRHTLYNVWRTSQLVGTDLNYLNNNKNYLKKYDLTHSTSSAS